jgi:cellulose synthase/poly-beta-1,6-N-acetylglucosamine synthase-like glycosyltransferase
MVKFSIIIPFKEKNAYLDECMHYFAKQNYKDFEVILLPDISQKFNYKGVKFKSIVTGEVKPARKRNIGIENAKGDLLFFIDDDAYPEKDVLKNALKHFKDPTVGAIGGPNLTPKEDSLIQHVSGDILASFASGSASVRYKVGSKIKEVYEMPTCNLIVRKSVFKFLNGFDETLLTAEDSKLCFDIRDRGYKLLYTPDVIVHHHRRVSVKKHLKQMWIYGRDLAWLLKERWQPDILFNVYPMPAIFVAGLVIGGILSFFSNFIRYLYFLAIVFYMIFIFAGSITTNIKTFPLIMIGLILTHISYGLGFIAGLFIPRPKTYAISRSQISR